MQTIVQVVVWALGALILLDTMGLSITPLLASVGIGSLAVGLALKDTLSNFFSGFYITMENTIHVGDFVKLQSGQEGYVAKISWRSTQVRLAPNSVIVVPNAKLATESFINYSLPQNEMDIPIDLKVSYEDDLTHVETITLEVARETMREVQGTVAQFEPIIRYQGFDEWGIRFVVILRGQGYSDQFLVRHEFIKRLHKRYREKGVEIFLPRTNLLQNTPKNS